MMFRNFILGSKNCYVFMLCNIKKCYVITRAIKRNMHSHNFEVARRSFRPRKYILE